MSRLHSRKAILVKYTNTTKGSGRYTASAQAGRASVPYDYESHEGSAAKAAAALCAKLGWSGAYAIGTLPNGNDYVFVAVDDMSIVQVANEYAPTPRKKSTRRSNRCGY